MRQIARERVGESEKEKERVREGKRESERGSVREKNARE